MASHHEQVLEAVLRLVAGAYPGARSERNVDKPARVPDEGLVIVHDGDPGEPDVLMSPLSYTYERSVPIEVGAYETGSMTAPEHLDQILVAVGRGVEADRTLGGLCEWLELSAPTRDVAAASGTEPLCWADLNLTCVYTVKSPVG